LQLWDVASGKELRQFTGEVGLVEFVAFLPDGKTVASMSKYTHRPERKGFYRGTPEMQVRLWDVVSGKQVRSVSDIGQQRAAISADGRHLATGQRSEKVWDMTTGKELVPLHNDKSWVLARAFSPDGRKLVTASETTPNRQWITTLFEVTTGEVVHRFDNFQKPVLALAVSPRGNVLASGAADGSIHLWHLESGKELRTLRGHQDAILSLAFSPDGNRLVSGS